MICVPAPPHPTFKNDEIIYLTASNKKEASKQNIYSSTKILKATFSVYLSAYDATILSINQLLENSDETFSISHNVLKQQEKSKFSDLNWVISTVTRCISALSRFSGRLCLWSYRKGAAISIIITGRIGAAGQSKQLSSAEGLAAVICSGTVEIGTGDMGSGDGTWSIGESDSI